MTQRAGTWNVAVPKAHWSELIEAAERDGPQTISKRGRPVAVLVSVGDWESRARRRGSLADFFASALTEDDDVEFERIGGRPRELDL